jgi:RNA polymerase sigma factor (sigma-70 family)
LEARLLYLAWRWYRIPSDTAEDIVQTALVTFIEVRERYPNPDEHSVILVGIFRNKCREYIARTMRAARGLRALRTAAQSGTATIPVLPAESTPDDGVLHELVNQEDGRLILGALSELRPKAREMFSLIIEKGATRQELIEHYKINKNTLDSRLHAYRNELREILSRRGLDM